MSRNDRKAMVRCCTGSRSGLSLSRQCQLVKISRSSLYYQAKGESTETLDLMREIDRLYMQYPFYGSR